MKGVTDGIRSPWVGRAPLMAAAAIIVLVNGINISRHYELLHPLDPFEAAETVEAWRSMRGIPVYDAAPGAHATHMYGALAPWTIGKMFELTGPNNRSGRLITLAASLALAIVLARYAGGDRSWWFGFIAFALLLSLNRRSSNYFIVNRPDMPALLFASLGVLLMGLGHESRRWSAVMVGTACVVAGFFFKQTAAIVAAVPLVALVLRGRRPSFTQVVFAVFPLALTVAMIQGMKLVNPAMYRSMILMPKAFRLNHPGTIRIAMELLLDYPLFLLLVGEWIKNDVRALRDQPRLLWIVATLAVAFPFSAITTAKVGGTWNSQLPALLTMTALVVLRLPRLTAFLDDSAAQPARRFLFGAFLAVVMLLGAFPHMTRKYGLIIPRTTVSSSYQRVVARVAELPGVVLSPEDPTIELFAKQRLGRNLYNEYDYHLIDGNFPKYPPRAALDEIRTADYLVDVRWYFNDLLTDEILTPLGFEPVTDPAFDDTNYRLWRRKAR